LGFEDLPMYLLAFVAGVVFAGFVGSLPDRIFHKNLDRAVGREFSRAHPQASWVCWVYPWVVIPATLFQFIVFTPLMMFPMQKNATAGCVAFFLWPTVILGGMQGVIALFELLAGVSPAPPPGRQRGRICYGRDESGSMAGCFRLLLAVCLVAVYVLVCLCAAL
jgi:hypothetical protein